MYTNIRDAALVNSILAVTYDRNLGELCNNNKTAANLFGNVWFYLGQMELPENEEKP